MQRQVRCRTPAGIDSYLISNVCCEQRVFVSTGYKLYLTHDTVRHLSAASIAHTPIFALRFDPLRYLRIAILCARHWLDRKALFKSSSWCSNFTSLSTAAMPPEGESGQHVNTSEATVKMENDSALKREPEDLLSNLPPELVQMIAELMLPEDILACRQTCRSLHANSQGVFMRRYIAERPFLIFDPRSMDKLDEIVSDPVKRQVMRSISFNMATLHQPYFTTHIEGQTGNRGALRDVARPCTRPALDAAVREL